MRCRKSGSRRGRGLEDGPRPQRDLRAASEATRACRARVGCCWRGAFQPSPAASADCCHLVVVRRKQQFELAKLKISFEEERSPCRAGGGIPTSADAAKGVPGRGHPSVAPRRRFAA